MDTKSKSNIKKRECLACGRKFPSKWVGNRICPVCARRHKEILVKDHDLHVSYSE
jgi:rRNA maturation endonuclease Nob1